MRRPTQRQQHLALFQRVIFDSGNWHTRQPMQKPILQQMQLLWATSPKFQQHFQSVYFPLSIDDSVVTTMVPVAIQYPA